MRNRLSHLREALALFLSVFAVTAVVAGFTIWAIPTVARWTVEGLAWIKGARLDEQLYGIPRSLLWEERIRQFGAGAGVLGLASGFCVFLVIGDRQTTTRLYRCLVFVVAFFLAYHFREAIQLPFTNPLEVVGPFTLLQQNPLNNTLQYLLLILFPVTAVALLDFLLLRRERHAGVDVPEVKEIGERRSPTPWSVIAGIAAWVLVILIGGATYSSHYQVPLNVFHEGETLGPAVQWENGQAPYKDFAVIHGAFQDPLRSVVAFAVFGRSIAASRTMDSILLIVSHFLFAICIFHVYNWNLESGAMATALLLVLLASKPFDAGFDIPHRDILLFLFLLSIISLYRMVRDDQSGGKRFRTASLLFLCALFPVSSFAYSIDRGYFLTAGSLISVVLIQVVFIRKVRLFYALAFIVGGIVGTMCIGFAIRWEFPAFLRYTFGTMPKVHELGFGLPVQFNRAYALVPVLLTAFNASWITHRVVILCIRARSARAGLRRAVELHFVELLLLLMSVLFFKSALGRASDSQMYYSSGLTFLLTTVILIRHLGTGACEWASSPSRYRGGALALLMVTGAAMYLLPRIDGRGLYHFPLGSSDEEAIPHAYRPAVAFLRDSLAHDETFLTLTSEGIWYYLLDRQSPTRFGIAVYAFTSSDQREFVKEIDSQQVDYVLVKSGFEPIDGIPIETKLPFVTRYIRDNYEPFRMFEEADIWHRKGALKRKPLEERTKLR
jgi:hypothetical protein